MQKNKENDVEFGWLVLVALIIPAVYYGIVQVAVLINNLPFNRLPY